MKRAPSLKRRLKMERLKEAQRRLNPEPQNPNQYRQRANAPSDAANLDWSDPADHNRSRLHKAVYAGNAVEVLRLIKAGASLYVLDGDRLTPMGAAMSEEYHTIAQMLALAMNRQSGDWHNYKMKWDRRYRYKNRLNQRRTP